MILTAQQTLLELFYGDRVHCTFISTFMCKSEFSHAVIWYQVFLSNTVIWYQVYDIKYIIQLYDIKYMISSI